MIPPLADNTSVPADTAQQPDQAADLAYKPEERTAIDAANEAFAPVVEADTKANAKLEDIEGWAPRLVKGVRAIRDRAMRETGALNHLDNQYRSRFGDLLHAEQPIGPWLLAKNRRAFLDRARWRRRTGRF